MQRRWDGSHLPARLPASVGQVLGSAGAPLDSKARAFMESRFGQDFSGVRVHTDARAAESAHAVHAVAYTVGHDVVFGTGQYAPNSGAGRELLAHELAHVEQQRAGPVPAHHFVGDLQISDPADSGERHAELRATQVIRDPESVEAPPNSAWSVPSLQRVVEPAMAPLSGEQCDVTVSGPGHPVGQNVPFAEGADTPGDLTPVVRFVTGLGSAAATSMVNVDGFANTNGPPNYNLNLSCRRANRVTDALILQGIPRGNITTFAHGETEDFGANLADNRVVVISSPLAPSPSPPPAPAPAPSPTPTPPPPAPPLCPAVPTTTPSTCAARHAAYCAAATCLPANHWLPCACTASADICDAIDAFTLDTSTTKGLELLACALTPSISDPFPSPPVAIVLKGLWFRDTNRCIWGHWRAALDAIHDPTRPIPGSLTSEWSAAVSTCRVHGVGSPECCQAHVVAEQHAIDTCGPYNTAAFGPLPTDVPGAPGCSIIAAALASGPAFTGDFGNVADRIAYGKKRCCS